MVRLSFSVGKRLVRTLFSLCLSCQSRCVVQLFYLFTVLDSTDRLQWCVLRRAIVRNWRYCDAESIFIAAWRSRRNRPYDVSEFYFNRMIVGTNCLNSADVPLSNIQTNGRQLYDMSCRRTDTRPKSITWWLCAQRRAVISLHRKWTPTTSSTSAHLIAS